MIIYKIWCENRIWLLNSKLNEPLISFFYDKINNLCVWKWTMIKILTFNQFLCAVIILNLLRKKIVNFFCYFIAYYIISFTNYYLYWNLNCTINILFIRLRNKIMMSITFLKHLNYCMKRNNFFLKRIVKIIKPWIYMLRAFW